MESICYFFNDEQGRLLSDWSIDTLGFRFLTPRATENLIDKHSCRKEDFYFSLFDHLFRIFFLNVELGFSFIMAGKELAGAVFRAGIHFKSCGREKRALRKNQIMFRDKCTNCASKANLLD